MNSGIISDGAIRTFNFTLRTVNSKEGGAIKETLMDNRRNSEEMGGMIFLFSFDDIPNRSDHTEAACRDEIGFR